MIVAKSVQIRLERNWVNKSGNTKFDHGIRESKKSWEGHWLMSGNKMSKSGKETTESG